tara:strand:- start:1425 stop:2033 length:609 start_codon:yes stop_codon:yes gene_type:complete
MKTIVITGPTCSGKTYLSNNLSKIFDNSIILKTDSYYRDDLFIKLLSTFIYDIYDRIISIKNKSLMHTITSINNKEKSAKFYNYDFRKKISSQYIKQIQYKDNKGILILEGIFAHRLDINYKKTINILCNENKEICYERRLKRDLIERGRNTKEVNKKFFKSWDIYSKYLSVFLNKYNVIQINTVDKASCKQLISKLNYLIK